MEERRRKSFSAHLYRPPEVFLRRARVLVVHHEASHALQEPGAANAVAQHAEDARALAVCYRVEALQNAGDVPVVLLDHRVGTFLGVRLRQPAVAWKGRSEKKDDATTTRTAYATNKVQSRRMVRRRKNELSAGDTP